MKIVYDIDGFFSPANMMANQKLLSMAPEQVPIDNLFEQYYLGLRSAMFICEDTIKEVSEALDAMKMWREGCAKSAMSYVNNHIGSGKVKPPDFLWIIKTAIIDELKDEFPAVENIQLTLSMRPRLFARVVDKNIIQFPALARAVLNHYNLLLINSIINDTDKDGKISGEPDIQNISRFMLPYLLFCHDDISVQNLPIIGAHSFEALNDAMRFTCIQLIFILAHEYAHILLKHYEIDEIIPEVKMRLENEADLFALRVVLGHGARNNTYSQVDAFAAIRWLFKYQLLEESLGVLIRGGKLEFPNSKFEERRAGFQSELIKNHNFKGSNLFETRGFYILVKLQSVLNSYGVELVDHIISKFRESKKTGNIEPWWKKIANK